MDSDNFDWESPYRAYRFFRDQYRTANEDPSLGLQVFRDAMSHRYSRQQVEREAREFGVDVDIIADWSELMHLRDDIDRGRAQAEAEYARGDFDDGGERVYTSAYQAALLVAQVGLDGALDREGLPRWFWRGQNDHTYTAQPSIFRGLAPGDSLSALNARVDDVGRVVAGLAAVGLGTDELTRIAVAQHYKAEIGAPTWLLDVTSSPWTALWFATDREPKAGATEDDDVGVLEYIERTEFISFGHGLDGLPGGIEYVSPTGIPRIQNQAGFFIDSPHPALWGQMVHRQFRFRQRPGVRFDDASATPPATRTHIYPSIDPVLDLISTDWHRMEPVPLARRLDARAVAPPEFDLYWGFAEHWLSGAAGHKPWQEPATEAEQHTARRRVRLHTELVRREEHLNVAPARPGHRPSQIVTIHSLRSALDQIRLLDPHATALGDFPGFELLYGQWIAAGVVNRNVFVEALHAAGEPHWVALIDE